jgi:hypothetical protein
MADDISLKDFLIRLLEEQEKRITLRFDALDKALILSHQEMERRLEGLNQLRNEVTIDRGQFTIKEKCESKHEGLKIWQDSVNKKLTILETRSITWTAAVGIFFLLISFAMRWFGK